MARISNKFLVASLVVIGIAVYMVSFGNAMFWDDDDFILKNAYIQDVHLLPKVFSENIIAGAGLVSNYYRPVLELVFSLEWHLWGAHPVGWHVVNTLVHVGNGVLLFYIILRITDIYRYTDRNRWIAYIVALLFIVHPVQVEAVAYVNSFGDSLSVFFMFLGILCFQKYLKGSKGFNGGKGKERGWAWLLGSIITYSLALLSKETAIIMPGLLGIVALYEYRVSGIGKRYSAYLLRLVRDLWSFAVIAGTYVILRATLLNFKNSFNLYDEQNVFSSHLWVRLLTFLKIIVTYIGLLIWPAHLHMERSVSISTSVLDGQVVLGTAVIIVLAVLALKAWRQVPLVTLGIAWFFIALAPTSNILVPINGLLYEHWLYVPMIGLVLATVAGGYWLGGFIVRTRNVPRQAWIVGIGIIVLLLCGRTILRIREWRDPVTFYTQTLSYAPQSYRILNNLGMVLANEGQLADSIAYYERAISIDGSNPVAHHNLANTYAGLGNVQLALLHYNKALEADPRFLFTYGRLINLHIALGDYASAIVTAQRYEEQVGKTPELESIIKQLRERSEVR